MNNNTRIVQRYRLEREVGGELEVLEFTSDELMDYANTLWAEPEEEFDEDEDSEIGCQRLSYHLLETGGEEKALEMLEEYEGYTILKLCDIKDIIVFERDDLTAAGFDMSSLAGDSEELTGFLTQKLGLPEEKYIIVESHGRLKKVVAISKPKLYELLYWWYSSLDKSKTKEITKKLEYANTHERVSKKGFDFDLLEEWREEIAEVMAIIGDFDTSDYSVAFGIVFEDFISRTKEYRRRTEKRKNKQQKTNSKKQTDLKQTDLKQTDLKQERRSCLLS